MPIHLCLTFLFRLAKKFSNTLKYSFLSSTNGKCPQFFNVTNLEFLNLDNNTNITDKGIKNIINLKLLCVFDHSIPVA